MSSSASSSAADPDLEPLRRAFKSVAVALKESGMPFALAGGYAAWVHGAPEPLHDVDFLAHGSPVTKTAQSLVGLLPDGLARPFMQKAGVDRLAALYLAIDAVRRGGTISVIGVYGGAADPMPMLTMFDKQLQLRMGQANVRRWVDDILPLLGDDDPLGVDDFATHRLPLDAAPDAYGMFQQKRAGAVKVLFQPGS